MKEKRPRIYKPRYEPGTLDGQRYVEDSREVILRRNQWLVRCFSNMGMKVELTGNPNHPMVMYKSIALATHVKNFHLIIKRYFAKMESGDDLLEITLGNTKPDDLQIGAFRKAIAEAEHQVSVRIGFNGTDLCLSGYNFVNKYNKKGRYPVFSAYGHKYFPNITYTEVMIERLRAAGYPVGMVDVAVPDDFVKKVYENNEVREVPDDFTFLNYKG